MSSYIEVPVATNAIIIQGGKILLQRLNTEKHRGKRSLPGGKVHRGETFEEAFHRVMFEQTGIGPELYTHKRIGILHDSPDATCKHLFDVHLHKEFHDFYFDPEEVMECRRYAINELPDTPDTYKASRVLPTIRDYTQGTFSKTHQLYTHE